MWNLLRYQQILPELGLYFFWDLLLTFLFFFFWINKNFLPKGQSPKKQPRTIQEAKGVSREDIISWSLAPSGEFTVSSAWNHFRPKMPVVNWHYTIWFPQAIRRHAFIVWMVIHDRLVTQDKLLKWGLINSLSCVFCRANVEDRNHLFFGCQVTAGIWLRILRLCGNSRMPRNWENEFL